MQTKARSAWWLFAEDPDRTSVHSGLDTVESMSIAIVSADSGTIATWAARYIEIRDGHAVLALGLTGDYGEWAAVQYWVGGRISRPPGRLYRRRRRADDVDG